MERRGPGALGLAAMMAIVAGCAGDPSGPSRAVEPPLAISSARPTRTFDLEPIMSGLDRPTYVGAAPGDAGALWVAEQAGRVLRVVDGRSTVVLDISAEVLLGTETGLLGVAFHPRFSTNRRLFLHWSDQRGDTRVAEFLAADDGRSIRPEPTRNLLLVDQPEANHNGGQLAFGPDGRLYLGLGDGGGAFDPLRTAQDPESRLGKILAADVDTDADTDVDDGAPRWDIVLTGLRNPWRFSFDAALGDLWVADVGQDRTEEVNRVALDTDGPPGNLGWSAYEGTERLAEHNVVGRGELVFPVATYTHEQGCSIIGGVVYGGTSLPALSRRYVFGDFCTGTLWSLSGQPGGGVADASRETAAVAQLTHIGTDSVGELVFASATGTLFRAVPPGP